MLRTSYVAELACLALAACGNGSAIDAAAADARPDADPWSCSIRPLPEPTPSSVTATRVFDEVLPRTTRADESGLAAFLVGGNVLVFSKYTAHRVAIDGSNVVSTELAAPVGMIPRLRGIVRGADDFGAVVDFSDRVSVEETHFCIVDNDGILDTGRCFQLPSSLQEPQLAFDGANYKIYLEQNDSMHRWVFDSVPSLVSESDLWTEALADNGVVAAFASPSAEWVVTFGAHTEGLPCSTLNEHRVDPPSHTMRSLLPTEFRIQSTGRVPTARSASEFTLLFHAVCRIPTATDCSARPDLVPLVARYGADAVLLEPTPIALPVRNGDALFLDSDGIVVSYVETDGDVALSQFSSNAEPRWTGVVLPVAAQGNVEAVDTGVAVGSDDYVIVYVHPDGGGLAARIARFTLSDS